MTQTPPTDPPGQTPPGTDPPGQTPPPPGQTPSGSQKTSIESLPADIQEYIARLRSEAEEANKQKKAEAKAKQAAEEARLAEAGQFKELAAAHETRVKELEPIAQSYAKLAETINAQIDAETREWPKEVKALLASTDSAVEQRLEQMTKLRPLLEKLQAQAKGQNPGNRPNPPPAGSDNRNQNIDELRQRYQASRGNPF